MRKRNLNRILLCCFFIFLGFGCRQRITIIGEEELRRPDRRPPEPAEMMAAFEPVIEDDTMGELVPVEALVVKTLQVDDKRLDKEGRYSVKVRDGDIRDLLLAIGRESPYNFVIGPEVLGMITVDLKDVPLEKLLNAVLRQTDLTYQIEDDIIWVQAPHREAELLTLNYIITERHGSRSVSGSASIGGGNNTGGGGGAGTSGGGSRGGGGQDSVGGSENMAVFENMGTAMSLLLSDEGQIEIDRQTGLITVVDYKPNIRKVSNYLDKLQELLYRQVEIEVKLVEVSIDKDMEMGIDWDVMLGNARVTVASRTGDEVLNAIFQNNRLKSVLRALSERHQVAVKTSPRITTLNNQTAMIVLGEEEVYFELREEINPETGTVERRSTQPVAVTVGVSLSVMPHIDEKGVITMNIHPVVTERIGEEVGPDGQRVPEMTVREVDTVARVRDGETLMIAGLTLERKGRGYTGVPYLSRLPYVGRLLRTDRTEARKIELVIFITPRLVEL